MKRLLFFLIVFVLNFVGFSQVKSSWKSINPTQKVLVSKQENDLGLNHQLLFSLNESEFRQSLTALQSKTETTIAVAIPNGEGKTEEFAVVESSNFAPELQAKYPEIRSYSGTGITDPKASISFSVSPDGVSTMVLRGDSDSEFIERADNDKSIYVLSSSKKREKGILPLTCKTVDVVLNKDLVKKTAEIKATNGVFKTLRLALSCTGEYTQFFGGTVNNALAAMNATMTRVNGIFNRDLATKLEIISNNSIIIYTDAATDPYSDAKAGVAGAWNTELQKNLTSVIGDANYDIGHLFGASGGGGDAGCIGCVCVNPTTAEPKGKGSGFTSPSNGTPKGDLFDIDFVAHEMGHQLGANHTFSYDIEGSGVSVEPGSGSTIMGYAGITDYDVQDYSDDYFAYASIVQIQSNLSTKTCPVSTTFLNQKPVVNAGLDYTIPKSTAFVLNGTATDPDGNTMTYCWEQNDSASSPESDSKSIAYATKTNGPNFRSFLPVNVTNRYFPAFAKVLGGQLVSTWEAVPSVARNLSFAFTVRDNAALGSGQTNSDVMILTVDATKGPFAITSQNVADSSWVLGSSQTITWSVNGSDVLAGASNVNIKMSTDGGLTFPIVLAPNTPNDGSEVVTAPLTAAKNCRILIEPTANVFYAINSKPFALGYSISTTCNTAAYSTGLPAAIPESTTYAERTIDVPATTSEISDVNVNVKFTHTYISDVQIELVSPKGTVVKLFDKACGSTNSSLDLTYDDTGGALTCGMTANQTVTPAGNLSAFNGENPSGTWILRFRDNGVGDSGTLNSASVTICSSSYTTLATKHFETNDFVLYPNPNKGNFNIRFSSSNTTDIQVLVTDLSGRKIYDKKFANTGDFNQNIQLKNAAAGTYIVTVVDGDRKEVSKIIVK
ncbi:zinc-dependent metalloprotease [Flavobacterium gilvum]|uniref:Propanediol utilization protein n=1 Tax=Flavobacterium gilvum TaxID=1492737 RepID=A0AAC9N3I8_9FLAO|nr:zinc-dependent metalloprotease family protein [Flavobacterium gilvum]AOW08935.1 propanediol utilization protein [Flavobacterium gilvum]KFC60912.1 propanediol utilization protein [Flavobacterium gilvum]